MKYSKILLSMTALVCLAFQAYAQNPDQGLASMENWLDQPDNYFPWYSTRVVPSTANHIATQRFRPSESIIQPPVRL